MASERATMVSLRTLNTATVTLALGLVALAGWHFQNPSHFELIQVPARAPSAPFRCSLQTGRAKSC